MVILYAALAVIFIALLLTAIFQWLWNITTPEVFGPRRIGFWLAFRLLLIAGFLTSGNFISFNLR